MRQVRTLALSGFILIAVWLVLAILVGIVAIEWALHPARRVMGPPDQARAEAIAESNHAQLEEVSVLADDGARLRGWSMRPLNWNGNAVILLHGQSDNRAGMLGNANLLLSLGKRAVSDCEWEDARRTMSVRGSLVWSEACAGNYGTRGREILCGLVLRGALIIDMNVPISPPTQFVVKKGGL